MRQHMLHTPYLVSEAHFYSTEIDGELVLFDTGPPTAEALALLQKEVDLSRLKYLFITHCHIDHYGLSEYIAAHTEAQIFLPRNDFIKLQRNNAVTDSLRLLLLEIGFDEHYVRNLLEIFKDYRLPDFTAERFQIVEDSDLPARLGISCLHCPGHCQSDMVYKVGNDAITGDILIRNIFQTPLLEVDLSTLSGRFRNYDAYCDTLVKLQDLGSYRILPGHRMYVESLDSAIHFYVTKLLERAQQVKPLESIDSIRGVAEALFSAAENDPLVQYLKASEILFMRDFLAAPERLQNALREIGMFDRVRDLYGTVVG